MTKSKTLRASLSGVTLLALFACGGGGGGGGKKPDPPTPTYATSLNYTDPTSGDYRLVRGAGSTSNTLVLELVGPSGVSGRGINFAIQADTSKARFSYSGLAQNGDVFNLGSAPQLFKAVQDANTVRVSMAQKGQGNAKPLNGVLARVALQLQSGVAKNSNVTLSVSDAAVLPASGGSTGVTVVVGSLVAQ